MTELSKIPEDVRQEFEILASNTVDLLPAEEFAQKLARARKENRPLRIKYGADPSAPDIHLGHTVPIRKLRQFQELGHQVVFIIGGYTARIGDPSGKNSARPRLTKEQVNANAQTYLQQIFKILDPDKTEVVDNAQWLEAMDVSATIELMSKYTVSQMLEREDFHARFDAEVPIFIHEFIYPLLQGYDSIAVRADLEIGGTDQKFNLLVGRELQRDAGQDPQCIMTLPLLVGLDGVHKMSKSLGNYIGINESPRDMFGKSMSIPDAVMWDYFRLLTDTPGGEILQMQKDSLDGKRHPRDIKELLARKIVELYHDAEAARRESEDFRLRFSERKFPDETAEKVQLNKSGEQGIRSLNQLLKGLNAAPSGRELRRLIQQKSIKVFEGFTDEEQTRYDADPVAFSTEHELRPGVYKMKVSKTRFVIVELAE